jgi:hypothetical protein
MGEELWLAESATRLQLARRYRQSKYVLEHILRPSQLHSGGASI